jgi:hypothetical protein
VLYSNHPSSQNDPFVRSAYQRVKWEVDLQNEETFANINAEVAGSFQFYCEKEGYFEGIYIACKLL